MADGVCKFSLLEALKWKRASLQRLFACVVCFFMMLECTTARPLKVYAKGYSGRSLPPGGWTLWFNVDYPAGAGDFETYSNIVREYGRTCLGIPCRRPLAVKAVSVHGRSPRLNGDSVIVSARQGLKCHSSHQQNYKCADYKVRFYCPNLHLKCSGSRFYPQHHHLRDAPETNTTVGLESAEPHGAITTNTTTTQKPMLSKVKADKKLRRFLRKQRMEVLENGARGGKRRLRRLHKRTTHNKDHNNNSKNINNSDSSNNNKTGSNQSRGESREHGRARGGRHHSRAKTKAGPITADIFQSAQQSRLAYHPRHPVFH